MNIKIVQHLAAICVLLFMTPVMAASVTVTGNGSTFILNKNGGFDGVDGASREAVFVAALQIWADILVSPVDIVVDAEFSSALFCTSNSATLGSAGPQSTYFSSGAETIGTGLQNNVWYATALINAYYGSDLFVGSADITSQFNSDLGDSDCLSTSGWYYGMDGNTPAGYIDFYEVVLHELGHGLGILSLVYSDGSYPNGTIDIFSTFLRDQDSATDWTSMASNATRAASMLDSGNLVWNGAEVTALAGDLSAGVNGGYVQMYAPGSYESGSSVSHFDTALTPNELMEPQYTGDATYDHSVALLKDIGWDVVSAASANEQPVISSQVALDTDEDTALTLSLADLTVTDSDNSYPADFTLTVSAGSNYSVSGNTITPAQDFNGTLTVPVTVNDGTDDSDAFSLSVTVNSVNDKPVISAQSSLSVNEDNDLSLSVSDLTIADPDDSAFTLRISDGDNYTVSGSTVTPNANFNGTLSVPVNVNDGEVDSESFDLTVTVNAINDAPEIVASPSVSFDEDTSYAFTVDDFGINDVDDSSFTLSILTGSNYSVLNNSITPASDFNGTLTISAQVNDGDVDSDPVEFDVTVNAVNDSPVLSGSPTGSVVIFENYSVQFSATDVETAELDYSLSSAHGWLSIDSDGLLTGTPSASDLGIEMVEITVSDGLLSDVISFDLAVVDTNSADVSVAITLSDALVAFNESANLTATVSNHGPAAFADGVVTLIFPDTLTVTDWPVDCIMTSATQLDCDFTDVDSSQVFTATVSGVSPSANDVVATVNADQTDALSSNDRADVTLLIDDLQTTPTATLTVGDGVNTFAASVADLNDDGLSELVLANASSDEEQSYQFNSLYDQVSADHVFAENDQANQLLLVDLNNDEWLDVVFVNVGANRVYLNDGFGGYGDAISLGNAVSLQGVAEDFNDDGYVDLLFANEGANNLYLNNQAGGFILFESLGSANSASAAIIDYNEDTYPDVVVANSNDDDYVYLNNGADQSAGVFNASPVILGTTLRSSNAVVAADLNGDGKVNEIILGYDTADAQHSLVVYQIDSSVQSELIAFNAGDVVSVSVGDFDGNEEADIAVLNTDQTVVIWMQVSNAFSRDYVFESAGATRVHFADMNGDLESDFIITKDASAATDLFISNNPVEIAPEPEPEPVPEESPETVVVETTVVETNNSEQTTVVVVKSGGSFGWLSLLLLPMLMLKRRVN